ncbi:MAG TPA: response regulator transcription factor [bacterium]|nr:response regulator transcription factor [bacterium]
MDSEKGSRILLVEDEESLAVGLEYNLTSEGYEVTRAGDGRQALEILKKQTFDLIVLDVMLPYNDGFEVAEIIREDSPQLPILMLTARTASRDRIHGLEAGADDYLTKPFHLKELLLRIQGMLKRSQWYQELSRENPVFRFGKNEVNFENLICTNGRQKFRLTAHEAIILKYLIHHKGKIVSRKELLEKVWNVRSDVETRTIDNFIARLRKYFEPVPKKPIYFKSVRAAGYLFSDQ